MAYVGQYLPRDVAYDPPEPSEGAVWVAGTADAAAVRPDAAGACLSPADLEDRLRPDAGVAPAPSRSGQLLLLASMLRLWRANPAGAASRACCWSPTTWPRPPGARRRAPLAR